MKESFKATLWVNNVTIELNPFVEEFLARTVAGAVSALKGAEDIQSLEFYLEQGNVKIVVNGHKLPLTPFPNDIIANTLTGLVSSLKGVDRIESLKIDMKAL
jgi:hypothetical protein